MIALRVPTATVKLKIKRKATNNRPAKQAHVIMTARFMGQWSGQRMQWELPRDKLKPGRQVLQSNPERLYAHCKSTPLGVFKFILILELGD